MADVENTCTASLEKSGETVAATVEQGANSEPGKTELPATATSDATNIREKTTSEAVMTDAAPADNHAQAEPPAAATEAANANGADETKTNGAAAEVDTKKDEATSSKDERRTRSGNKRYNEPRRTANRDHKRFKENIVSTYENLPVSADHNEICRQVEFYFSDSNLPVDQYMLKLTGGHANNPVPLQTIHTFKRMKHFQPYEEVRSAVSKSQSLNLSDKDEITRKVPLDSAFTLDATNNKVMLSDKRDAASVYAKGFGDETERSQLDLEAFFEPYGPVNSVRLRRNQYGSFKGSVFVEFADEKTQQTFLELAEKPKWNGRDLIIMSSKEYAKKKTEEMMEQMTNADSKSRTRGKHVDKDDWKSRRDRDQGFRRGGGARGGRGRGRGARGGRGGGRHHGDRNRERAEEAANEAEGGEGPSRKRGREEHGDDAGESAAKKQATASDGVASTAAN